MVALPKVVISIYKVLNVDISTTKRPDYPHCGGLSLWSHLDLFCEGWMHIFWT